MGYPITMKEAVIKKVLMSGRPHHEIAKEAGIGAFVEIYLGLLKAYNLIKNHIPQKTSLALWSVRCAVAQVV